MTEIVFLLEEESAKVMLEQVVAQLVIARSEVQTRFIVFEGKQDLEKNLQRKLRGYVNPKAKFLILRDQDRDDCRKLKKRLKAICDAARRPDAVVRIACRELESFYLGDLQAVEKALSISGLGAKQDKARFRDPDQISMPSSLLEKLTDNRYQKVAGSRAIAPYLRLDANRSRSYLALVGGIRKCLGT
ncbi:MAG: DUF4276 family protein [Acidobacteria bacterium]|nr:DUF4276 family protein [Acidobacteriota bacterium]